MFAELGCGKGSYVGLLTRLLFVLLLLMPAPGEVKAVEPATTVATMTLIASVASLFDSGADPTGMTTQQIREMVKSLHDRMQTHEEALLAVMKKLDDMPNLIQEALREELKRAFAENNRRELLAAIRLILEDVRILEENGLPQADKLKRLQSFQQKARTMLYHGDHNLPLFVAAMRIERAYVNAIDPTGKDWEGREDTYRDRLTDAMKNLIKKANKLEDNLNKRTHGYDAAYTKVKNDNATRDLLQKLHQEVEEQDISERIVTLYRKMVYLLLMEDRFYISKFASRFISEEGAEEASTPVDDLRLWMDASEEYAFQILSARNREEFNELFPGNGNVVIKGGMSSKATLCVLIDRVRVARPWVTIHTSPQPTAGPSECEDISQ